VAADSRRREGLMTKAARKITLCLTRDIHFDKLMLSQSNVRRITASVSVEDLAEDIAGSGLVQSLNVPLVLGDNGTETAKFRNCPRW